MTKRIAGMLILLALLTVALLATMSYQASSAQSDRVIPVRAGRYGIEPVGNAEAGDSCGFSPDILTFFNSESQIIVRDENDTIIAVEDIGGVYEENSVELSELNCVARFDVDAPDAEFYVVHVNNVRANIIRADEFPLDAFNEISVSFD